jgi:hypothetical protein
LKGQVSIEFLASFFLYILAVVAVFQFVSGDIPGFDQSMREKTLHMEAKYVSDQVLTQPGYHTVGDGGTNWEKNSSTRNSVHSFGLASEYLVLDSEKLANIATVNQSSFNYSHFREKVGVDNQYKINFTWTPIVETPQSFGRGNPPPLITGEPMAGTYDSADNEVHYGSITLRGETKHFLVTSHFSTYNTTYVSDSWDFSASPPEGLGSEVIFGGQSFEIKGFQNREYDEGAMVLLGSHVKEFGSTIDRTEGLVKLNRYVVYDTGSSMEPMRVEVYAW